MSRFCGSEPLRPDLGPVVAEGCQGIGGGVYEWVRSAHEAARLDRWRPADLSKERGVDPSVPAGPFRLVYAGEGDSDGRSARSAHRG